MNKLPVIDAINRDVRCTDYYVGSCMQKSEDLYARWSSIPLFEPGVKWSPPASQAAVLKYTAETTCVSILQTSCCFQQC